MTCDDGLIRQAKRLRLALAILNPVDYVRQVERGSEYLLSGLLVCGRCGRPMVGVGTGNVRSGAQPCRRHYRARRAAAVGAASCDAPYVAADEVERLVVNTVLDRVLTPENFQRLLAKMRAAAWLTRR